MSFRETRRDARTITRVLHPECAPLLMRALEPRILLDAAGGEDVLASALQAVHGAMADTYMEAGLGLPAAEETAWIKTTQALEQAPPFVPEYADDGTSELVEIAFIAADVPKTGQLAASLPANVEIVYLNADESGLEQIAAVLRERRNVDAVHIFSHGRAGALSLGGTDLTTQSMSTVYSAELAMIGQSLTPDGDILIYGCDFASGDSGRMAVGTLARMTGADIAASTDKTGHSALGGNWELEQHTGLIESRAVDAGAAWLGALAAQTLAANETDPDDIDQDERIASDRSVGQTFQYDSGSATYEVDQIDLVLRQDNGDPVQNVIVSIRETFGGPDIASGTISSADLDDEYLWHSFSLDSTAVLNSNQTYYIVVSTDLGPPRTVEVGVEDDGQYDDGDFIRNNGTARTPDDLLFRVIHNSANAAPTIVSDGGGILAFVAMDENQTLATTVVATDPDVPADALTYSIIGGLDTASFTIDAITGELSFTTAPDFENPTDAAPTNGIYSVVVEVSDGQGGTDAQLIGVTVNDVNEAPDAVADNFVVGEDESVTIQVLINDSDPDSGDTLSITHVDGQIITEGGPAVSVAAGSVRLVGGELVFAPTTNRNGPASFTYTTSDAAGLTGTAMVSGTITPANDAPTATDNTYATPQDTAVSGNAITDDTGSGIDSDVDGNTLSLAASSVGIFTTARGGSISLGNNGDFTYTPASGITGADSFIYSVTDGTLTSTATLFFTISPVNNAPTAAADVFTVAENGSVQVDVLVNDSDPDGDALTITHVDGQSVTESGPAVSVSNGNVQLISGELLFTPFTSYSGPASFSYAISDANGGTSTAIVTGSVTRTNNAPDAIANTVTVAEDGVATIPVLANDVDPDGDPLSVTAVDGQAIVDGGPSVSVTNGTVQLVAGDLIFTPTPDYSGPVSFTYTITDGNGGFDTALITGIVTPSNDAPVAAADTFAVAEDGSVSIQVLANDSDRDGDTLSIIMVDGQAITEGGTAVPVANGRVHLISGELVFTPDADYNGPIGFSYTVSDGNGETATASATGTVAAINDAPLATPDIYSLTEDTPISGNAIADNTGSGVDSDIDGDIISLVAGSVGTFATAESGSITLTDDGSFTYTPPADFAGTDSFTYTVTDGTLTDTTTLTFSVLPAADAPVAISDTYVILEDNAASGNVITDDTGGGADFDVDGDALALAAGSTGSSTTTQGGSITFARDGSFTYTPPANFFGTDSYSYTITDGTFTDVAALIFTVEAVNDVPTATDDTYTFDGTTPISGNALADDTGMGRDSDADGNPLVLAAGSVGTFATNMGGTIILTANGDFTYVAPPGLTGTDSFTYTVTDGATFDTADLTFEVATTQPSFTPTAAPVDPQTEPLPVPDNPNRPDDDPPEPEPDLIAVPEAPARTNPAPATPPGLDLERPETPPPAANPGPPEQVVEVPADIPVELPQTVTTPVTEGKSTTYDFKPVNYGAFGESLKKTGEDIRQYEGQLDTTAARVTFTFGAVLGVGSVSWLLQSGILAATLLSAIPAWKRFDPIAIVSGRRDEKDDDEPSDIQMMANRIREAGARTSGELSG